MPSIVRLKKKTKQECNNLLSLNVSVLTMEKSGWIPQNVISKAYLLMSSGKC